MADVAVNEGSGWCANCGARSTGTFSIHRDGFGEGPEVDLCDGCVDDSALSAEAIWLNIKLRRVEASLRVACNDAKADDLPLIHGAFETRAKGKVTGVCALGAFDLYDGGELFGDDEKAWDQVENGWDGVGTGGPWWELGRKLAAEFSPVPASTVGEI